MQSRIDSNKGPQTQTEKLNSMGRGAIIRSLVPSLIINGALPLIIYTVLKNYTTVSDLVALLATGVPSIIDSIVGVIRRKRVDFLAGFTLLTIVVSLGLLALGGSPKLYLIRESFFTAAFGIAYLISLLFPKPIAFYFARYFMAGNDAEKIAWFDGLWQRSPGFRSTLRLVGLVWSIGLLLEAAVRTYLVLTLTVQQFLAVSPFVLYGITGALIAWSVIYGRSRGKRMQEARRQREAAERAETPEGKEQSGEVLK